MTRTIGEIWPEITATVNRRISGEESAVSTPWPHLDKLLGGGYWAGAHTLISTSGNGKSSFAMQVAVDAALGGVPVFYASLELDNAQIGLRAASCIDHRIRWNDVLRGKDVDEGLLFEVFENHLADLPLWVDVGENEGWDLAELEKWIQERRKETKATLFAVIDYLQLVRATDGAEQRQKISGIMRRIQNIARLQNVAILAISSTSRANYAEGELLEAVDLEGVTAGNTGYMHRRDVVMKMAKEAGEIEYGSTTLSALIRDYKTKRTFLLIAKRRIEDGGVWCSFRWEGTGFIEDYDFTAISQKGDQEASSAWT